MQPSDSSPTPPPKQSFWAKLFGKKPTAPVSPPRESHTPPPQLGNDLPDTQGTPVSGGPTAGVDVSSTASGSTPEFTPQNDLAASAPPSPDVQGSVEETPVDTNAGVPTSPPADSQELPPITPPAAGVNDMPPVAPPTSPPPQSPPVSGEDPTKQ